MAPCTISRDQSMDRTFMGSNISTLELKWAKSDSFPSKHYYIGLKDWTEYDIRLLITLSDKACNVNSKL